VGKLNSGDIGSTGRMTDYVGGQPIHQLLQNYQMEMPYGGNGWLRYYTFKPNESIIEGWTYSPYLDEYEDSSYNRFDLIYPQDSDNDGIPDSEDNCPYAFNPGQEDDDSDGSGDVCDNCPSIPNGLDLGTCTKGTIKQSCTSDEQCGTGGFCSMNQEDADSDGVGDACDNCPDDSNVGQEDSDSDSVGNVCDNCPNNPDQEDNDSDGMGNICDICPNDPENDIDGDTICGNIDNCPYDYNKNQIDIDLDGIGNVCDNCVFNANQDQVDSDSDNFGDICDNCPNDYNSDQRDSDGDGIGDACDIVPTSSSTTSIYNPPPPPRTTTTTIRKTTSSTSSSIYPTTTIKPITTTTVPVPPSTTTVTSSSTTTISTLCPIEQIYGEDSEEVKLLRALRDTALSQTPEGKELIKLYYEWSPVIMKAMEEDEEFEQEVKEIIDGVLPLIREIVE